MLAQSKWYFPPFSRIFDRVPALVHALVSQQDLRNRGTHTHGAFGHSTHTGLFSMWQWLVSQAGCVRRLVKSICKLPHPSRGLWLIEGLHNCAIRNGTSRTGGTSGWQKTSHGRESTILENSARERAAEVLANQSPHASLAELSIHSIG